MQCKKCRKECMESELINGCCNDCWEKYKNNPSELKNVKNYTAAVIKRASTIIRIIGYLATVILFFAITSAYNFLIALAFAITEAFAIFIITILLDGFAEIIQLLENLNNK